MFCFQFIFLRNREFRVLLGFAWRSLLIASGFSKLYCLFEVIGGFSSFEKYTVLQFIMLLNCSSGFFFFSPIIVCERSMFWY
jgi:hypothetical protein